jgi:hypothetical protein
MFLLTCSILPDPPGSVQDFDGPPACISQRGSRCVLSVLEAVLTDKRVSVLTSTAGQFLIVQQTVQLTRSCFVPAESSVRMRTLETRGELVYQKEKERLREFREITGVIHYFTCSIPYQLPDNSI